MGLDGKPECRDCALAGTLVRTGNCPGWDLARTAVSNFRQESMRLPGVELGLAVTHGARVSEEGELCAHRRWLEEVLPEVA